ncbi:MAG: hypothetical protein M3457_16280, partial [Chloroflexota bacterium]|nr:hypothetical protein [Chloroflexota bacterium]
MSRGETDLKAAIPRFEKDATHHEVGLSGMTGLSSAAAIRSGRDALVIASIAVALIALLEFWLTVSDTPSYVMPKPTEIGRALWENLDLFRPHI